MSSMKAIGFAKAGAADVLELVDLAKPTATGEDIVVKVHGFGLNPIDIKSRATGGYGAPSTVHKVLGWDASGVVDSLGPNVKGFKVGDEVYFAGDLTRNGSNAEYVAVDHRLASLKPKSVDHVVASSMPLTFLTAWEALENHFKLRVPQPGSDEEKLNATKSLLIVAGAGGVGSIAIQLAKKIFKVGKVAATAGRADSQAWCVKMGADLVLDRSKDYLEQMKAAGIEGFDYIFSCTKVDDILESTLVPIAAPFGSICSIVNVAKPVNMAALFRKALSLSFEFMGARAVNKYHPERQGQILANAASLLDNGVIQTWIGTTYDKATVENLRAGHALQDSGAAIGKIVFKAEF